MEIHFLGTGTPFPDPERGSSAILVDTGASRILLDCGRHCVQQMAGMGIAPSSVTHCFLTHAHYDHVADFALLVLTTWRFGRHHTLKIYGPPGTRAMSDALFHEAYKIDIAARKSLGKKESENDINIEVREMRHGETVEGEGWRIQATEVLHWPIPISLGFLLEGEGKRVFFSGDTAPCEAVRKSSEGVDLLIHEAMYFPPDAGHYRSHSHPERVGEIARQAEVRELVLTHLQPKTREEQLMNDAAAHFSQRITMATDRMRLAL
ncbi:MAG: MBL fold metallo-hydrolase [Candidatus Binatia bacterium]|jgi:ribonuclease Z|nr:MBL fold metallo-hydrolase [Candidatus Binatia bacterium]